ncbi:MAG: polyphosphate kinase 2, partial [Ktedonobacterales bacterium]
MAKHKNKKTKESQHVTIADHATDDSQITSEVEQQGKMRRKEFEKALQPLQVELVKLQEWVKHSGAKVCVLFEGRDAAGKGGVIKLITERTSPRVFRV